MHWHDRMEILYVREGALTYIRGGEKGTLQVGQVLFIPPRMTHYARVTEDVVYDVLMFDVRYFYNETEVCREVLPGLFEGRTGLASVTEEREVLASVDRLCRQLPYDSLEAVAEIYALLGLLVRKGLTRPGVGKKEDGVRAIAVYLEENFEKELSTAVLCQRFGYTAAHLCRKFKRATGLTPGTYLKIYRLEQAYRMLRQNEGSVTQIAARCGFSDANYFTRCFTAHYQHPPTYYKKA
ncbi:MAG: helix-turn-helix domain-containing protein [Clostridia bacterium]|nr:helix-turn-helix domain-containing protein [Clostridia bacterium]